MNCIKKAMACAVSAGIATLATATPEVSNVTMTQSNSSRLVTITYNLSEDAVVTLEVMTNATPNAATGWASIGGVAVCNAQGAVWRKVTSADADGAGKYTITWRPDQSWTDESGKGFKIAAGCAKAVVTAWALDNTPDYMVVDITDGAQPNTQKYYPSVDFLPGGLFGKDDYRTTSVVMRKIMAKDVRWTMGSAAEANRSANEGTHKVTLTNNYYIGVFEVTQTQWQQVTGYNPSLFTASRRMRPVEQVAYTDVRQGQGAAGITAATASGGVYPAAPYGTSFLGLLRTRTGIDFDLPSEAQWEFAARAGHGEGLWGDGSEITQPEATYACSNLYRLARCERNPSTNRDAILEPTTDPAVGGTAIVGTYAPNSWGLYDMHGNVVEWCLDWYADDISALNGGVNSESGSYRVKRGGAWYTGKRSCRSAWRYYASPNGRNLDSKPVGVRLACTAGLQ